MEDASEVSDDKSFNEDDCLEDGEVNYDSPFENINAIQELSKTLHELEMREP